MNKMDRTGADFDHAIRTMRQRLGAHPVPIQFPIGKEDSFIGCIDFIEEKAIIWLEETLGAKFEIFEVEKLWDDAFLKSRPDIAAALKASAIDEAFYKEHRGKVVEYIAEHDDAVLDKYLNEHALTARRTARFASPLNDCAETGARAGRFGLQEQGYSAAARRGSGLPAVAARCAAGRRYDAGRLGNGTAARE